MVAGIRGTASTRLRRSTEVEDHRVCACFSMILMKNLYTVFGLIFVFQSIQREYRNHQTLQFLPLCLVLSRFSSSRVSLESKLCVCFQSFVFFSPRLPFFSLAGCVQESRCALVYVCVCACVCLQTNVCRLCFSFEHPFDVAVYLFISLPAKALSRRLGLQRIGRALLWVPSISEEPLWRMNRWPRLPIAHQLGAEAAPGDFFVF